MNCVRLESAIVMTNKAKIQAIQRAVGVIADGIIGSQTLSALMKALGIKESVPSLPTVAQVRSNKSIYGKAGKVPLKQIVPPYPLYYGGARVKTITVHVLIADKVLTALKKVLDHYGLARIKELGLDQYDGCYNNRNVRGGSSTSMHAYAIALDFLAEKNGFKTKTKDAAFARPEYAAWWAAWESVGARSFGKANGYDWMHLEFTANP